MPTPVHGKKVDPARPVSVDQRLCRGERDTMFPPPTSYGK